MSKTPEKVWIGKPAKRSVEKMTGAGWIKQPDGFNGLKKGDLVRFPDVDDTFHKTIPGSTVETVYEIMTEPKPVEGDPTRYECEVETR